MKTKRLVAIVLLLTSAVYGRVGETREQVIVRYGQPSKQQSDGTREYLSFVKNNVMIGCVLADGKTVAVLYSFLHDIKAEDAEKLLEANGEGLTWKERAGTVFHKSWTRSDSSLTAIISKESKNKLVISRSDFLAAEAERKVSGEPSNLEGF